MPARTERPVDTPWLTPREAAARAKVGPQTVYDAVRSGRLKAARLGGRNDIRIHVDWLDAWIGAAVIVNPDAPGDTVAAFRKRRNP